MYAQKEGGKKNCEPQTVDAVSIGINAPLPLGKTVKSSPLASNRSKADIV